MCDGLLHGHASVHAPQRNCEDHVKDVNSEMKPSTQIALQMLHPQKSASQNVSNGPSVARACDLRDTRDTGKEWACGFGDFDLRTSIV